MSKTHVIVLPLVAPGGIGYDPFKPDRRLLDSLNS